VHAPDFEIVCFLNYALVFAVYSNGTVEDGDPFYNVTEHFIPLTCPSGEEEDVGVSNVTDDNEDDEGTGGRVPSCVWFDGNFSAFQSHEQQQDGKTTCAQTNGLAMLLNINADMYRNQTLFYGVMAYLFEAGSGSAFVDFLCERDWTPRCRTLAPIEDGDDGQGQCSDFISALSYDSFPIDAGSGTHVSLERSEEQYSPNCQQDLISWNPVSTSMSINPNAVRHWFGGGIGTEGAGSLAAAYFEFKSPRVSQTTYNPISAQSMFGSLSGWFGFLTDGWGAISIVYLLERVALYVRDERFR